MCPLWCLCLGLTVGVLEAPCIGGHKGPENLTLPPLPDLKTMTERLKNRYYVTKKLFIADLQRIITNCREYNPPDSDYCKCANTLEKFFYFKLKEGGLIDK